MQSLPSSLPGMSALQPQGLTACAELTTISMRRCGVSALSALTNARKPSFSLDLGQLWSFGKDRGMLEGCHRMSAAAHLICGLEGMGSMNE